MNSCADRPTLAPFAPVDLGGQHAYKLTDDEERGADRVRSDPGETPESGETGVLGKENAQEVSGGTGQQEHQYRLFSADLVSQDSGREVPDDGADEVGRVDRVHLPTVAANPLVL